MFCFCPCLNVAHSRVKCDFDNTEKASRNEVSVLLSSQSFKLKMYEAWY